jgi:hypothetical protein
VLVVVTPVVDVAAATEGAAPVRTAATMALANGGNFMVSPWSNFLG